MERRGFGACQSECPSAPVRRRGSGRIGPPGPGPRVASPAPAGCRDAAGRPERPRAPGAADVGCAHSSLTRESDLARGRGTAPRLPARRIGCGGDGGGRRVTALHLILRCCPRPYGLPPGIGAPAHGRTVVTATVPGSPSRPVLASARNLPGVRTRDAWPRVSDRPARRRTNRAPTSWVDHTHRRTVIRCSVRPLRRRVTPAWAAQAVTPSGTGERPMGACARPVRGSSRRRSGTWCAGATPEWDPHPAHLRYLVDLPVPRRPVRRRRSAALAALIPPGDDHRAHGGAGSGATRAS